MSDFGLAGRSESKLSLNDQIDELRARLDELTRQRVGPAAEQIAAKTGEIADQVRGYAREKADAVSNVVSHRPLTAVAAAAVVGFLIGRMR